MKFKLHNILLCALMSVAFAGVAVAQDDPPVPTPDETQAAIISAAPMVGSIANTPVNLVAAHTVTFSEVPQTHLVSAITNIEPTAGIVRPGIVFYHLSYKSAGTVKCPLQKSVQYSSSMIVRLMPYPPKRC